MASQNKVGFHDVMFTAPFGISQSDQMSERALLESSALFNKAKTFNGAYGSVLSALEGARTKTHSFEMFVKMSAMEESLVRLLFSWEEFHFQSEQALTRNLCIHKRGNLIATKKKKLVYCPG